MLTDDIGVFTEKGGTILFYISKKGMVVVDSQFPDSAQHLIEELKKKSEKPAHNGVLERFAEVMIHFHQNTISEADGPRSHFEPSSSQYTLDAMQEYGFFYGFLLGCDRLMRENDDPWIYPTVACELNQKKFDPVTKRKRD